MGWGLGGLQATVQYNSRAKSLGGGGGALPRAGHLQRGLDGGLESRPVLVPSLPAWCER